MADINSNKNGIIIQPITLQIRAPFQFLTNQRVIKHTHYSESRDALNGRCSFSVVCSAREYRSALLDCFIQHKVQTKLNRFHLFFTYISTSFSSSEEHPFCSLPTWHAKYCCTHIYTEYGSRLMAKEEKSTFQISSLLFKFIYFKYIYTRERLLLAKSAKQSEGKGVPRSQLQRQATTALRKNSVHLNRAGVIEINVCERQGR